MKTPHKSHEVSLPKGYREVFRIDATNKKVGLILNLAGLGIAALVAALWLLPLLWVELPRRSFPLFAYAGAYFVLFLAILLYILLHELTHGAAYKLLTHSKLTFGLRWSCAFCGVPDIYTYRRTALIALTAPLLLFSFLFGGLAVAMAFVDVWLYVLAVVLFVLHISGCVGDGYMTLLLFTRFKDPGLLMRDTGPEQWIYLPEALPEEPAQSFCKGDKNYD